MCANSAIIDKKSFSSLRLEGKAEQIISVYLPKAMQNSAKESIQFDLEFEFFRLIVIGPQSKE